MKIKLLKQVLLVDGDANVANHPGSVLDLPAADAQQFIDEGSAEAYVDPQTDTPQPAADKSPAAPFGQAGAGADDASADTEHGV